MTPRRVALLSLLLFVGCSATDEKLVVVPHEGVDEAPFQPIFRWEASFEVAGAEPDDEIVAWVPLPQSTDAQGVRSLLYQLGPAGKLTEERTPAGDRLLRVRARRSVLATLRVSARFEQRSVQPRDLPPELAELDRTSPEGWVDAARAVEATARLVHGVRLSPDGDPQPCLWPELKWNGEWVAVDLEQGSLRQPPGQLRLATVLPRATLHGKPVPIQTHHRLTRSN